MNRLYVNSAFLLVVLFFIVFDLTEAYGFIYQRSLNANGRKFSTIPTGGSSQKRVFSTKTILITSCTKSDSTPVFVDGKSSLDPSALELFLSEVEELGLIRLVIYYSFCRLLNSILFMNIKS